MRCQMKMVCAVFGIALVASLPLAHAQSPRPKFEVATIKPTTVRGPVNNPPGGRYVAVGQSLKALIQYAYRLRDYQVLGGPAWASTELWEIQAKAAEDSVPPRSAQPDFDFTKPDTIDLMVQSLLEDRFKLKMRREKRELPVYELVVAKGGPKIALSDDQSPIVRPEPGTPPLSTRGSSLLRFRPTGRAFEAKAITLPQLINLLTNETGRTVIDRTGLTGLYDMKMEWTPENLQATPDGVQVGGTLLTTAIQEQLGLRLESSKAPVEVLVIDTVQKPSEN